ncbi:HNH endonuclease signature motif containing protein [Cumulibacter manganitolerans]|uniref:HNH endonuclease signature motif containing protein n=1 Tax=Cumulibacter manganitolerans TaxID=1884992 RepID=UPI0018861F47|nr:HNH endonuclease signature motif containing protein [Cumulibacter manganitolerans]
MSEERYTRGEANEPSAAAGGALPAFGAFPMGMDPTSAGELDAELLAAFAALDAGFTALEQIGRRGDLQALGPDRLIAVMQRAEAHRSRLACLDSWFVEAATTEDLPAHLAARSVGAAIAQALRIAPATAAARVRTAEQLLPKHNFSTGLGDPELPALADAVHRGAITGDQLRLISAAMRRLTTSATVTIQDAATAEAALVQHAAAFGPTDLRLIADRIDDALLPDGTQPSEAVTAARRGLRIGDLRADGTHDISGSLTRELAAQLHAVLDPLAAPQPADDPLGPDTRSPAQRTHDALADAIARLLDSPGLPRSGGTPATVHLVLDADALFEQVDRYTGHVTHLPDWASDRDAAPHADGPNGGDGVAGAGVAALREWDWLRHGRQRAATSSQPVVGRTSGGIPVTLSDVAALAAEALLVPVWMSDTKGILGYGREKRICPEGMTNALIARDRGCSFPGCTAPPEWCERHHVVEWLYGGRTDLDELTLVCGYHHREFERRGWRVTVYDGRPVWIPPRWLDPDQQPLVNLRSTNGVPLAPNREAVHAKAAQDEARRHAWRARSAPARSPAARAMTLATAAPSTR